MVGLVIWGAWIDLLSRTQYLYAIERKSLICATFGPAPFGPAQSRPAHCWSRAARPIQSPHCSLRPSMFRFQTCIGAATSQSNILLFAYVNDYRAQALRVRVAEEPCDAAMSKKSGHDASSKKGGIVAKSLSKPSVKGGGARPSQTAVGALNQYLGGDLVHLARACCIC